MKLFDFLVPEAIVPQLAATDRDGVIDELVAALVSGGACTKALGAELVTMILDREKRGSTGFGKGVAVPHVKHEKIKKMGAAIGVSQAGVDFHALDKAPVFSVILLLSPKDNPDEHLQAMENIFSHLQNDTFRRFLRQAETIEQIQDIVQDADAERLQG